MAKAGTKLQTFLSQVRSQHTPRSERFEVIFNLPGGGLEGISESDVY